MLILPLQIAVSVLVCVILAGGLGYLLIRPRIWRKSASDVLILAAHQDDCVVLAGEYALWALEARKTVKIVYLTCGADSTESPRAKIRAKEALAVWASAGVPAKNLHFLGYSQSNVSGPCVISQSDLLEATARIANVIRATTPGTAVFVPAAGESHVDHRELRRISLKAIKDSGRGDLMIFEVPEYNPCLSVMRTPRKVLEYFVKSLPLISRLAKYFRRPAFPGFVRGGHSSRLPNGKAIHQKKIEMLRRFLSEDGELLVRYFSWRNQFRPVMWLPPSKDESFRINYLRVGDQRLGLSVIAVWLSIYLLCFGISWRIARGFEDYFAGTLGASVVALCVLGSMFMAFRGAKRLETRLLYVMAGLGMIVELFLMYWR